MYISTGRDRGHQGGPGAGDCVAGNGAAAPPRSTSTRAPQPGLIIGPSRVTSSRSRPGRRLCCRTRCFGCGGRWWWRRVRRHVCRGKRNLRRQKAVGCLPPCYLRIFCVLVTPRRGLPGDGRDSSADLGASGWSAVTPAAQRAHACRPRDRCRVDAFVRAGLHPA